MKNDLTGMEKEYCQDEMLNSNLKLWQVLICVLIVCGAFYWFFGPHRFDTVTPEPTSTKDVTFVFVKTEYPEEVKAKVNFARVTIIPKVMDMDVIVSIESSGDPDTPDSPSGARGLCQIMPKTWAECTKRMGVDWSFEVDAHDPVKSLAVGTFYINKRIPQMIKYYKLPDTFKSRIIAYSWGIGNLRKYDAGKVKELPKETSDYINKYISRYMFKETILSIKKEASKYTAEEWMNLRTRHSWSFRVEAIEKR
jgi:hypothetical protein